MRYARFGGEPGWEDTQVLHYDSAFGEPGWEDTQVLPYGSAGSRF